jgi:acetyl esterase/lipase
MSLTLDVMRPTGPGNQKGVILVVSGGWMSSSELIAPAHAFWPVTELTKRGYTVFAVAHGSQPKFTIPEILDDMHRAVRFIRSRATEYKISPDKLGIFGMSSGGHLALMQATAGDAGNPEAKDPVNRESSRVQAVACYHPPTDFLNYGTTGTNALQFPRLKPFLAAFDYEELNPKSRRYNLITDTTSVTTMLRNCSPITHVTPDDPPALLFHGDADTIVPIQQAEIFVSRMRNAGKPAELVVKKGANHGWKLNEDFPQVADWFDKHLD